MSLRGVCLQLIIAIPYSGKFSNGANFRVLHMKLRDMTKNRTISTFATSIFDGYNCNHGKAESEQVQTMALCRYFQPLHGLLDVWKEAKREKRRAYARAASIAIGK